MPGAGPLVLTYHSVSDGAGPTCIAPGIFAMQMEALADAGYASMTEPELLDWRAGGAGGRKVLISFDDAFLDFRDMAQPVLSRRGFGALVFAPTGRLGGVADWGGAGRPPAQLMGWDDVVALARDGVAFGAHGVAHADLTALPPSVRRREIERSGAALADRLGRPTLSFAAPYGRVDAAVVQEIASFYRLAFGVRLDRPSRAESPFEIARIDMHYFRDQRRWRRFLEGADDYLRVRQTLRGVRGAITGLQAVMRG